jgi:serine-type D-Ala-D-Ala carboxypeptidase/endopeptidase (penicillin-binding protein 4)
MNRYSAFIRLCSLAVGLLSGYFLYADVVTSVATSVTAFASRSVLPPALAAQRTQPLPADSTGLLRLREWAESLQRGPLVQNGTVALSVRRVQTGERVFGQNEYMSLPTASTLKLVSTGTALAVLGPTYTYNTYLEYDGLIRDSTLVGNLYLRGTGDPSLGSGRFPTTIAWAAFLREVSARVRQVGIRRIEGAVIGDATYYETLPTPDTWPYGDLGNYYGAGLYGLNINENLYRLVFKSGAKEGQPTSIVRTDPAMPYLTLTNRVLTGPVGSGDEVNLYGVPFQNSVIPEGTIPPNATEFTVKGAMPDPAYFVAHALTAQFRRDSIRVVGSPLSYRIGAMPTNVPDPLAANIPESGPMAASRPPLARYELTRFTSPPLSDLARETNYQSINLYAEALLRTTARALRGKATTWPESISAITGYWQSKGLPLEGFRPRDGSGLSTVGAMTADNLTSFLTAMSRETTYPAFYASIPVVGQNGTVRGLARGTKAAGNVRAKSGTIEGVRAYSGYFTAKDGTPMCFSLMINKYQEGQYSALTPQIERLFNLLVGL